MAAENLDAEASRTRVRARADTLMHAHAHARTPTQATTAEREARDEALSTKLDDIRRLCGVLETRLQAAHDVEEQLRLDVRACVRACVRAYVSTCACMYECA